MKPLVARSFRNTDLCRNKIEFTFATRYHARKRRMDKETCIYTVRGFAPLKHIFHSIHRVSHPILVFMSIKGLVRSFQLCRAETIYCFYENNEHYQGTLLTRVSLKPSPM